MKRPDKEEFTTRHTGDRLAEIKRLALMADNSPGVSSYSKGLDKMLRYVEANLTDFVEWRDREE